MNRLHLAPALTVLAVCTACQVIAGLDGKRFTTDGGDASTGGTGGDDAGAAGTGGVAGASDCTDVALELCMRPTWLAGVVPYGPDSTISADQWRAIEEAVGSWRGTPIGESTLQFRRGTVPGIPSLVFTSDTRCGPVMRSADGVTLDVASCPHSTAIAREIGATLGLPRMHQRADRDRYLAVADASAFDCHKDQFHDECSLPGGPPAQIGAFGFSSLMLDPGASVEPAQRCALEPNGSYLYVPRGVSLEPTRVPDCDAWVGDHVTAGTTLTPYDYVTDHSALTELYAMWKGWMPFLPVGVDRGADRPLDLGLSQMDRLPALVALPDGHLAAFVWGYDQGNYLYKSEYDGSAWSGWDQGIERPASASGAAYPAAAFARPPIVDLVVTAGTEVLYTTYDGRWGTWSSLGGPPQTGALSAASVVSLDADTVSVFVAVTAGVSTRVYAKDLTSGTWSAWQPLPDLPSVGSTYEGIAASATQGRSHLVVAADSGGMLYTSRDFTGGWNPWTKLPGVGGVSTIGIVEVSIAAQDTRVDVFSVVGSATLTQTTCEFECQDPTRWSVPSAISGSLDSTMRRAGAIATPLGIDLVAVFDEQRVTGPVTGLWHKRWVPIPAEPAK